MERRRKDKRKTFYWGGRSLLLLIPTIHLHLFLFRWSGLGDHKWVDLDFGEQLTGPVCV